MIDYLNLLIFFVKKILSAHHVCLIYSNAFKTNLITGANTMKADQTAPIEQPDLG